MKLVLFGSGEFGIPTFQALSDHHEILQVVTQPARRAGRGRSVRPTPVADWATAHSHPLESLQDVNAPANVQSIRLLEAEAWVVIAFGQKLSAALLQDRFAVNLHASLLPKFRGAAPINHAVIAGESTTGLTVITLADRIDAGDVLGSVDTPIHPNETAGELHDRLALLGPDLMLETLSTYSAGHLAPVPQIASDATSAPKFTRSDGTVDLGMASECVRNRVHGLTPWPGCDVLVAGLPLRLLRVRVVDPPAHAPDTGYCTAEGIAGCGEGYVEFLEVRAPGSRSMDFPAWYRGQHALHGKPMAVCPA